MTSPERKWLSHGHSRRWTRTWVAKAAPSPQMPDGKAAGAKDSGDSVQKEWQVILATKCVPWTFETWDELAEHLLSTNSGGEKAQRGDRRCPVPLSPPPWWSYRWGCKDLPSEARAFSGAERNLLPPGASFIDWTCPGCKPFTTASTSFSSWILCVHKSLSHTYRELFGESWTIKKAEHQRIDAFELWCWRRLLRVPWTARRSNQSILQEINLEYSWEGLMLKLKLQYFCPPDEKSRLTGEDPDAGKDWK